MANEMQTSTMLPQAGQVFAELLEQKHAPKGDLQTDFKTALYLCAATKHYTFEEVLSQRRLDILSFMLSSVGFKGSTSNIGIEQYLDTVQELLNEGAIEYIGEGAGFVASGSKKIAQGEVRCARSNGFTPPGMHGSELRFNDGEGKEYPLFSKFLTIPGDKVKVVINTFLGAAYVVGFVKMRASLIGDIPENSQQIYFREKGLNAYDIRVTKDNAALPHGSLVIAEIVARRSPNILIVKAHELKGDRGILDNFIIKAIFDHNITSAWPETVKKSVKSIPQAVSPSELKGRVDLREMPLVTIDGEDARDFDDAVYCEVEGNKYHLYVAIADVSYYVRTGSAIDAEALERTTSVYFPYFVVPMLPEELSNGICSLNPNVDRLCMVCDMIISKKGKIESYDFYPAVMKSHARLTYTEVHNMITEGKALYEEHEECLPWIQNLYQVYLALKKASNDRGVFTFESTEVSFLFNEKWQVKGMEPNYTTEANQLIEECMIAANICAATFVKDNGYQSLYRVHTTPSEEKLDRLRAILSLHGIDLPNGYEPTPQDFRKVADQVSKLPDGVHQIISLQMLRSMSKATYSPDNVGHFGLALQNYSHFTSPIRRYPDLQIHRVIKYILEKKQKREWGKIGSQQYGHEALEKLGASCTKHEIDAANAEYDVDNSLKCEYLKNFINEVVDGTVSAITSNGVFITLNDFFIDGMLKDVYLSSHGEKKFSTGYGKDYKEGDAIKVRVCAVNSASRMIDLLPVLHLRRRDNTFDMEAAKELLKNQAKDNPKGSNDVKLAFLDRMGSFSRGIESNLDNTVSRAHLDYSVESSLKLDDEMDAAKEHIATSKAKASPKKTAKKENVKAKASSEDSESQQEVEDTTGTTIITVKRKSKAKGAQKTTVIALDDEQVTDSLTNVATKSSSAKNKSKKSDEIDPLLVDTALRIDADLATNEKVKSSKTKGEKVSSSKSAKTTSKSSKSNAKSKQVLDEEAVDKQEQVSLTNNLTLAKEVKLSKPQAKKAKTTAQSVPQVDEVKEEVVKTTVKKAPAKKAPAKSTKSTATKSTEAKTEVKEVVKKAPAKKAPAKATTKVEDKAEVKEVVKKAPAKKAPAKATTKVEAKSEVTEVAKKAPAKKAPAKANTKVEATAEVKEVVKKAAPAKSTKSAATKTTEAKVEVKEVAKKAPAKKAPAKATTKVEAKTEVKEVAKKAAPAKSTKSTTKTTEAKAEVKEVVKKAPAKKAPAKATTKVEAKTEVKEVAKKAAPAKSTKRSATKATEAKTEVKEVAKKAPAKKAPAKTTTKVDAKTDVKEVAKKAAPAKSTATKKTVAKSTKTEAKE